MNHIALCEKIRTRVLFRSLKSWNNRTKGLVCEMNSMKDASLHGFLEGLYDNRYDSYVTYNNGVLIIDFTRYRGRRRIGRMILTDETGDLLIGCMEIFVHKWDETLGKFEGCERKG